MKAVVIHAPGAPEQLVMADVPEPAPGPGEVLVDVAFAGCNWADTQIRTGIYPHARTYPLCSASRSPAPSQSSALA